jgi:lipopolysaccharide biosynthesis protein
MRRVVFYLFFDQDGQVDDYVLYALENLRVHSEHIFVVSNSKLDMTNRARLETVADTVWERENVGFDVWAYKEAMSEFTPERLSEYDEIILMNHTFFGPVSSFDPLFASMDSKPELDFWGVTNHGEVIPHPFNSQLERMPMHIQSHWIAIRRSLFTTSDFLDYWSTMPMITSYNESIEYHESRFTEHFSDLGYTFGVEYPESDYPSLHPVFDNSTMILRDGCPIVKRRTFFHDPLYLDRNAILGREIEEILVANGYPIEHVYSNLSRTTQPRVLATNLSLVEILPEQDLGYDRSSPLRIAAVVHIYYQDMTDEILDRLQMLPESFDLFVTTTDESKKSIIASALERRGVAGEVRVVESNRGRAESAFFVGCRDVIESDDYDLIVKLHSKKSPQDDHAKAELFKRHLMENLLGSPGYTANVLRLFQQHPTLGMVFPPVIHMSYPTLGHAWFTNREAATAQAKRLGIRVPFDDSTPVAPYGTMLIARPQALRRIAGAGYSYDDFPDDSEWGDSGLPHVLERLMGYAAQTDGFHVRQTLNIKFASIYYAFLEYKLQAVAALMPAYPEEQIAFLHGVHRERAVVPPPPPPPTQPQPQGPQRADGVSTLAILKYRLTRRSPKLGAFLQPGYRLLRGTVRRARRGAPRRTH